MIIDKRLMAVQTVVIVICIIGIAVLVSDLFVGGVQDSELRICHRLNVVRAQENRNNEATYNFDRADYTFDQLFISALQSSLPTITDKKQKAETIAFISDLTATANSLDASAHEISWIPLTNCHAAVYTDTPAPQPVLFSMKLPPASAFSTGPGN